MKKRITALVGCFLLFGLVSAQVDDTEYQKVLGYVEPYRNIDMTSSENGLIAKVHVKEGEKVAKGAPVMELDNRVLEAQLRIAEVQAKSNANIAMATAEYSVSYNRYNLLRAKQKSGSAHSTEVNRANAEAKKAESQLQMAKEEQSIAMHRVEEIRAQIERRILRSPIDGIVLEVNRDVAESSNISKSSASEKEPALVRVAQLDKLRLVVHLPADSVGDLKTGDDIDVLILIENSLRANREGSGTKIGGVVEFLSPDIDPSSETIRARIVIENEEGKFRSGSHAFALLPKPKIDYSVNTNN